MPLWKNRGMTEGKNPRVISVLIVDDDPVNLKFAETVLEDAGYRVTVASNGAAALRIDKAHGVFDLFIIDVKMPEMEGDEVAQRLRDAHPRVKVLYYTAFSDSLFEGAKALAPGEAVLNKPADIEGLREAVSLILFGHVHGPTHQS